MYELVCFFLYHNLQASPADTVTVASKAARTLVKHARRILPRSAEMSLADSSLSVSLFPTHHSLEKFIAIITYIITLLKNAQF